MPKAENKLPVRTLEFKAVLTEQQKELFAQYQELSRRLRNHAIYRLKQFDEFHYYYKATKDKEGNKTNGGYAPCCPVPWQYKGKVDNNGIEPNVPYTQLINNYRGFRTLSRVKMVVPSPNETGKTTKDHLLKAKIKGESVVCTTSDLLNNFGYKVEDGGNYWSCPVNYYQESPLDFSKQSYVLSILSGEEYLSSQNDYLKEILKMGQKYRITILKELTTTWNEYIKSRSKIASHGLKRGQPLFKPAHNLPKTIANSNPDKKSLRLNGNILSGIAIFKSITLKGSPHLRLMENGKLLEICIFRLIKKGDTYYCQLALKQNKSRGIRNRTKHFIPDNPTAIACDPGLIKFLTFDDGRTIDNPRYLKDLDTKIKSTQSQINHKLTTALLFWLNNPERQIKDITNIVLCKQELAFDLLSCKSEQMGIQILGAQRWQRLKRSLPKSNAIKILEARLTKYHDKLKRQRRSFAHRVSTYLVRNYDYLIVEHGLQKEGLRHKAKAKQNEHGQSEKNNQSAKAGLTKSLVDAAHGQFLALCETKFKEAGKTFVRFDAKNTTKTCPVCGTKDEISPNYPGQKIVCSHCGFTCGRDQRPGIYMLLNHVESGFLDINKCSEPTRKAWLKRLEYSNKAKNITPKSATTKEQQNMNDTSFPDSFSS